MKAKITIFGILSVFSYLLITGFSGKTKNPTGAPAGHTGSPYDNKNCTVCHGGTAVNVTGFLSSNVPSAGYTPGMTYLLTCAFSGTGNKGFQISPQNAQGNLMGTIFMGTNSQLVGDFKYITHASAISATNASWSFTWVAPDAGTGPVTFYGAAVIGKPNVKLFTLTIPENTGSNVNENTLSKINIYPNPTSDYLYISGINSSEFEINFYSFDGKLVKSETVANNNSYNKIETADLSKGIYLTQIKDKENSYIKKIVIN
jgi:hypothetical protein